MITPKFDITQDEKFVIVTIHVPYIKISDTDMYIEGTEFKFYIKPYYLRLNFSHEVVENGAERAQYDVSKGDIVVHIPKKESGQVFEDLDMISKLLAPKSNTTTIKPKIQVLGEKRSVSPSNPDCEDCDVCVNKDIPGLDDLDEDFSWEWEQEYPDESNLTTEIKYGFCERYSNYFEKFVDEYPELLDLKYPDECPAVQRKIQMDDNLLESFDMEHYLSDFMDLNEFLGDVLHYEPEYITMPATFTLVEDEHELLLQLPRVIVNADRAHFKSAMIGLVDILFAFVFDHIMTSGEVSVESAWNICKLSSQLSWLHTPTSLNDCIVTSCCRALTFPLYRHFDFCQKVFRDVKFIVSKGRVTILKCLLGVYDILRKHEFYYLLNNIYLKDYILWVQNLKDKHIEKLEAALNEIGEVNKQDIPFPLEEFEIMVDEATRSSSDECSNFSSDESSYEDSSEEETEEDSEEEIDKGAKLPIFDEAFANNTADISCLNIAVEQLSLNLNNNADPKNIEQISSDNTSKSNPLIEEI